MADQIKVMTIFGTRPEAIKMAPFIHEIKKRSEFECTVVVTAQHREMLDQVLEVFHITPDFDLDIMSQNQTLTLITTRSLEKLDKVMREVHPDIVLVHGDTSTTLAGSLAAYYNQIPVGHIEAGLRTWDKYSPFPEEMNRQLTSVITDLHFSPTENSKNNLLNEGIDENRIIITGNTVIDALKNTVSNDYSHPVLNNLGEKRLILLTAHR